MTEALNSLSREQLLARANRFRSDVNDSASLVRNLYFTFLLLGTYVAITIASTSDEQLLKGSPVNLPIIGVDLPIFAFYGVTPWLLLLFHLNLLLQMYLLSRRMHLFNDAVDALVDAAERRELRIGLFPFPFVQMMAGDPSVRLTRTLTALIVWVTTVLVPTLLMVATQVVFLPYHDITMTWWQRLAVLLDLTLIWVFWPMIVTPVGKPMRLWWVRLWQGPAELGRRLMRGSPKRASQPRARGMLTLAGITLPVLVFSTLVAVVPGETLERISVVVLPGSVEAASGASTNSVTHLLFDASGAPLHRNLNLAGRVLVAGEVDTGLEVALRSGGADAQAALGEIVGIDLSNRDLRMADLRGAIVPKAVLQGVNLDGADLREIELQDADLRPYDITRGGDCIQASQLKVLAAGEAEAVSGLLLPEGEVRLCVTTLRGAKLSEAHLSGARLALADMEHADLRQAMLDAAGLRRSNLDAARLGDASLVKATLAGASLVKADLTNARLMSADLVGANLSGAILERTHLNGADLTDAKLADWRVDSVELDDAKFSPGAPLAGARIASMRRARLERADLSGADLNRAKAESVRLRDANLRGATLENADLHGADLAGADLRRARLAGADLKLAVMQNADFRGATLWGAELQGGYLTGALLQGAGLQGANLEVAMLKDAEFTGADLAGARLGGSFMFARLDLSDLRRITVTPPPAADYGLLQNRLWAIQRYPHEHIPPVLTEYIERPDLWEQMQSDPFHGAQINAPIRCDRETDYLDAGQRRHCIDDDQVDAYIGRLMAEACADADMAYGVAQRAMLWTNPEWLAKFYHRGKKPDAYPRLLAERLLDPACEAGASLGDETTAGLKTLLEHLGESATALSP